jgi:hypothetical protein
MIMPNFEFAGSDPIEHFHLGRIVAGDVVEFDEDPGGEWKSTKKKPRRASQDVDEDASAEPASDKSDTSEEG